MVKMDDDNEYKCPKVEKVRMSQQNSISVKGNEYISFIPKQNDE